MFCVCKYECSGNILFKAKFNLVPTTSSKRFLLTIIHFLRAANFYSCFEWWYDADTYTILQYLEKERINSHGQISLNTSWIFFPSFDFHVISENKDWIKLAPFHKDVQPDSSYQYYYATGDDKPALESNYDSVLSLGWDTRFLMKRKK